MCKTKNLLLAACFVFLSAFTNINEELISKVAFGSAADVEILLSEKADPNATNAAGVSAIFLAANRDDPEAAKITEALIKAGANVYANDQYGNMPIIMAVRNGNAQTVKVLIQNKALVTVKDARGNDLLKIAENRGDAQIVNLVRAGQVAEQKKLADLKSNDNLTKMVQKYAFLSCANLYLKYYKKDNPGKMTDEKFALVLQKNDKDSDEVAGQLTSLFDLDKKLLNTIEAESKRTIKEKLDSLLTNENRLYNGFGTNADLNKRCKQIAEGWSQRNLIKK